MKNVLILPQAVESSLISAIPQDRYQVIGVLGQGGAGTVFKARDLEKQIVAIKVTSPRNKEDIDRVNREIELWAKLRGGPHILQLLDTFRSQKNSATGLVFPYIDGASIQAIVEHSGHGLHDDVIAAIITQSCAGLAFCHDKGIIHRDIKPSNILIASDGEIKLCDFGIAISATHTADITVTSEGSFVGTMRYAAPDIISGNEAGPESDIYSLGVTILFMLLGRQPLDGLSLPSLVQNIIRGNISDEIPESRRAVWGGLLAKLLNPDPLQRPTARQLADTVIRNIATGEKPSKHILSELLSNIGSFDSPTINPPTGLTSSPQKKDDESLKGLVESLTSQVAEVHAAIDDLTAQFKQINTQVSEPAAPASKDGIDATFSRVAKRLEWNWQISLIMTIVFFSLFVSMLVLAIVFSVAYEKTYWALAFGGGSAASILSVTIWKPMDKLMFATIATQQLELIQINYQNAMTGNKQEQRDAFRDVSQQLNSLLSKVSTSSHK